MARYSRQIIDSILERTDLVKLIDTRVSLKKKGKDYWACCPFHHEKTASFSVSADKQIYYCFGCHAHGNALDFLIAYERLSFLEALEMLAEQAGVVLPETTDASAVDQRLPALRAALERSLAVYQAALTEAPTAQAYWQSRGVTSDSIAAFGLGYAPDGQRVLAQLGKTAAERDLLLAAGVLGKSEDGRWYERFRGRVIFAIRDGRGRLSGLAGRSLDGREPKYLNSPETPLYHKAQILFGLDRARAGIRRANKVVLVEGYLDVISLHQAGIDYAVAASGTALGETQLETLFRASKEVILCFDGDGAGRQAAQRAVALCPPLLRPGRLLRVLFLPEGEDPDSLVRQQGAQVFLDLLQGARPAVDVYLEFLASEHNLQQSDELAQYRRRAREFLERLGDPDLQAIYREKLQLRAATKPASRPSAAPRIQCPSSPWRGLFARLLTLYLRYPEAPAWSQLEAALVQRFAANQPELAALQRALEISARLSHLSSQDLCLALADEPDGERYLALLLGAQSSDAEALIEGLVANANAELRRLRSLALGQVGDRAGIGALTPEEREELRRHLQQKRASKAAKS
ncbi:DNA primase [Candidatus Igneacidithiobacillus taiwanensis]|uniref:DNA primase n=1 Tax=Candidatus Igneacidithiobacillus taiwanensis TaxID=1945924 RepID=UPI0028972058|nr:DNA primase [Candidatus Igneacidithiobacillus taiwanensis]MCE5360732.1 DNA primase [Acidithiobacillus sp.]